MDTSSMFIFNRVKNSLTRRVLNRILSNKLFKKLLLNLIRDNRLHFPEYNNGSGLDITFIEYSVKKEPHSAYLHNIVNAAVNLLDEEFNSLSNDLFKQSKLESLLDYNNHYLFLTQITNVLKAKNICEIGTASGMSLWAFLRSEHVRTISTWDLNPLANNTSWFNTNEIKELVEKTILNDKRYLQYVEDLSDDKTWSSRIPLFLDSDIIFIDGPHNDFFEKNIVSKILELKNEKNILLIFDDIHTSALVDTWNSLPIPKLDVSGVGHQSGTGLALLAPYLNRKG